MTTTPKARRIANVLYIVLALVAGLVFAFLAVARGNAALLIPAAALIWLSGARAGYRL